MMRYLPMYILVMGVIAASIAYAVPPMTALPGSTPLPRYSIVGSIESPVPINVGVMLSRGVTEQEAQTSGVIGSQAIYLENLHESTTMHPWAFYAETRTRHAYGDATVVNARLRNEGRGWGAASHSEIIATGSGTTIGNNVEVSPMGSGRTVGINIQAHDGYGSMRAGKWTNEGLMFQSDPTSGFVDTERFECRATTQIHFAQSSSSERAIWIEGTHTVGVDLGSNPIRMNGGTTIQLEATGRITVSYGSGRIVFRNGSRVLGYLVTDGSASGGRLN